MIVEAPADGVADGKPNGVLALLAPPGLMGEIRLWRGEGWLPPEDSRLLKNIVMQTELALERARAAEGDSRVSAVANGSLR